MISADGEVCFSISKIEHSDMKQQLGLMMMMRVMVEQLTTAGAGRVDH